MKNEDKNCKSCMHLDKETEICGKWNNKIPNIHSFKCSHYEFVKEFENIGKVIFDRDTQELRYEFGAFRVADMEYPNYHTMELYKEHSDWFTFKYYFIRKAKKKHIFNIIGSLTLSRTTNKHQRKFGTRVSWEFEGNVEYNPGTEHRVGTFSGHGDEDGQWRMRKDTLELAIQLINKFEETGDPWSLTEICDIQGIRSEKYNKVGEY